MIKNFVSRLLVSFLIATGLLGLVAANSGWAGEQPVFKDPAPAGGTSRLPATGASAHPLLSFVQISDIHVGSEFRNGAAQVIEDIKEINSLAEKPSFVITTGDLTNDGGDRQLEQYKNAMLGLSCPLYNAIGNHDTPEGKTDNYVKWIGPDYYSFDLARKHFIILDSVLPSRCDAWLKNDLANQPAEKEIIVFQHYPPDKPLLDLLSRHNTKALFYGHVHDNKTFYYGKILVVSTPPLCLGGIDCSPRGFRVVTFDEKGGLTTAYRWAGVNKHLAVISPVGTVSNNNGTVPIKINTYDSAADIERVLYSLDGGNWEPLAHAGGWLWRADPKVEEVPGKAHALRVRVIPTAGSFWEKEEKFSLGENQGPALIWNQFAGGETGMSTPVVEQGRLYLGVQDNDNAQKGGVVCLDGANGKVLWKAKTGCSVNGAPALSAGIVCAVSVAGSGRVFALDAASGKELWRYDMPDTVDRCSSLAVSDGVVYCGVAPHFVALDLRTGKKVWQAKSMGRDVISCRTTPAVDDKNVYVGFNWSGGLFALNRQTGSNVWNNKEGVNTTHASPVICGGTMYYAADSKLYAFDKATGKELWRAELAGVCWWTVSSPAVKDATLVVGAPAGAILAFNAQTGQKLWSYQTKTAIGSFSPYQRGDSQAMSSPVISEDKVYIGSTDGNFYILDLKTGKRLSSYDLGAPILASPVLSGNIVYIVTYDGNIFAFRK